jgi:pectate lyase
MLKLTAQSLEAYARYGYVAETNEFKPLFADGRDLTGFVPARPVITA